MLENDRKPSLRFKGFNDAWEQCKLSQFYDFSKGKGLPLDSFYEGRDSLGIAYGHLYTKYSEVINEVKFSSTDDSGALSMKGDLLFPGSSTVPFGTAQSNAIMLDNVKLGGDVIIARAKDLTIYAPFISYQINAQRSKLFPITVGTTITHMYGKDIRNIEYKFPKIDEQEKIGRIFESLDSLITLHQRKYDKLVSVKKALLDKMFPETGNDVPKIRFKGFTDAWEQHKLSDICDFHRGQGLSWDDVQTEGKYPCVLYGNLYTDYGMITDKVVYYTNSELSTKIVSKTGDVLIPGSDTTPTGLARATSLEVDGVILGGDINILRPKYHNGSFLSLSLNNSRNKILPLITGTTVRHLQNTSIKTIDLVLAEDLNEQSKIVATFKTIDSLITLHQRKHEKLQNIKKALLSKMFA